MGKISFVDYTLEVDQNILLEKVNITLHNGNTYFINGKNGCGKSTFLKTITREYKQYTGEIFIDDVNLKDIPVDELFGEYISYLPQVYETKNPLSFYQIIKTLYPKVEKTKVNAIIKELDLSKLIKKPLSNLSGGQQQRVLFAFHILSDCPIIILDEFENNLDPEYLEKVKHIIENERRLLIIVSHIGNIKNSININFVENNLIIENGDIDNKKDFKTGSNKIKRKNIFGLIFKSNPLFHMMYLFALVCIFGVAIFTGFKTIDYFAEIYSPTEEFAEVTNDTSMAVICSGCTSYQMEHYAADNIPSNELYFDYEDYETLKSTEGVKEVVITSNPGMSGGAISYDGFKPKSSEFEYEGFTYETNYYTMAHPKELALKMPKVYGSGISVTYGELPDDNTSEILVAEVVAYEYYGKDVDLKEKVGTTIELVDEEGNIQEFIISGFSDDISSIYYSYHEDDPSNIENNLYLAAQSSDDAVKEEAIDIAYNTAQDYSQGLKYDEFITDNPDFIQGFYIELEDPKYMQDVEELIWSKYPNAVIYDDNVYNTHPPLNTVMPIFKNLVKKIIIILIMATIILGIILFSYNVKRNDLKQFLLRNGVSKKAISYAELLDTSITVILAFALAIVPYIILYKGDLFYFGTIIYFIILILLAIICDIVIKKILTKVYNAKN